MVGRFSLTEPAPGLVGNTCWGEGGGGVVLERKGNLPITATAAV